jgi:hypothetical protein
LSFIGKEYSLQLQELAQLCHCLMQRRRIAARGLRRYAICGHCTMGYKGAVLRQCGSAKLKSLSVEGNSLVRALLLGLLWMPLAAGAQFGAAQLRLLADPLYVAGLMPAERIASSMAADGGITDGRVGPGRAYTQRLGYEVLLAGLGRRDERVIALGVRALAYPFERGSFGRDPYDYTASFAGAWARAVLLPRATERPEASTLAAFAPRVRAWADAATTQRDRARVLARFDKAGPERALTNQLLWGALEFNALADVLEDPALRAHANELERRALSWQRADGSFPEKGGTDTSYQAVSLRKLAWLQLGYGTTPERGAALQRGMQWMLPRVGDDCRVDVRGNTRTAGGGEVAPSGRLKGGYHAHPELLVLWSHAGGGEAARAQAEALGQACARVARTKAGG